MRHPISILLLIILMPACKPAEDEKTKILYEAELSFFDYTYGKIRKIDDKYHQSLQTIGKHPVAEKIRALRRVCSRFYDYADSVSRASNQWSGDLDGRIVDYRQSYSFKNLDSLYRLTLDSIRLLHPDGFTNYNFRMRDYRTVAHREASRLTSFVMINDVAANELAILQYTIDNDPQLPKYPDDGTTPYTIRFPSAQGRYSFSINNKYLQQFRYRDIFIDSVMKEGKLLNTRPMVSYRDVLAIVELKDLKKGKYVVQGSLSNDLPIFHVIEIKK